MTTVEAIKDHLKPRLNGPKTLSQAVTILVLGSVIGATAWALRDRLSVEHRASNLETRMTRSEEEIEKLRNRSDIVTEQVFRENQRNVHEQLQLIRTEMRQGFQDIKQELRHKR